MLSMSGLPVTRSSLSASVGALVRMYSTSCSHCGAATRCRITSSCCSSVRGRRRKRWKCCSNKCPLSPPGREVTSMACPCGARTPATCRSTVSRASPPSSMPVCSKKVRVSALAPGRAGMPHRGKRRPAGCVAAHRLVTGLCAGPSSPVGARGTPPSLRRARTGGRRRSSSTRRQRWGGPRRSAGAAAAAAP